MRDLGADRICVECTVTRGLCFAPIMVLLSHGCGDAVAPCNYDDEFAAPSSIDALECLSAKQLAARDTVGLYVTQQDIDIYLDLLRRSFAPIAPTLARPPLAGAWASGPFIDTTNPLVARAWTNGDIATGIIALDEVTSGAGVDAVERSPNSNIYRLGARRRTLAPAHVAAAIQAAAIADLIATTETFMPTEPAEEITVEAPLTAAIIPVKFQIGWGDCFVDCTGQHFWRVDVATSGATLREERGDPIPADVLDIYRRWPDSR